MTSTLDNLAGPGGSLKREAPDRDEYSGLIRSAKVRLKDAENLDNSLESRFDLVTRSGTAVSTKAT